MESNLLYVDKTFVVFLDAFFGILTMFPFIPVNGKNLMISGSMNEWKRDCMGWMETFRRESIKVGGFTPFERVNGKGDFTSV